MYWISRSFVSSLFLILSLVFPLSVYADKASDRAALQAQLAQVQQEIEANQIQLKNQQTQRVSLERDVSVINSQVKKSQLELHQRQLAIQALLDDIDDQQKSINDLDAQVKAGETSIADMLRQTQQSDGQSFAELALGNSSLSDVFQQVDTFTQVQGALRDSFAKLKSQRTNISKHKAKLEDNQQEQQDLLQLQQLQTAVLKGTEQEKKTLVTAVKGQEAQYQKVIASKKQTVAQIQAALFTLRDTTTSVSFGDMYNYAKEASAKTGVRAAVILGILAEESNLGQNVGKGNWKTDMHPTRDAPIFADICASLGINPDTQPVSKKQWYGWGGAMGPAQFIPSTWKQYADRIATVTGQNPANPWNPRTAAFATAMLMGDNGADGGTRDSERLAALRYLAGYKNASKPSYAFYGDQVMNFADKFQSQIDQLGG